MAQQVSLTVKAGVVILVGVILLVGLSLHSAGRNWFYRGYELKARFSTAKGVEVGTQVAVNGVPVGHVQKIEIDPTDGQVHMLLNIERNHTIPAEAIASIRLKTLLGNYHIYVDFGKPGGPNLKDGDEIHTIEYKDVQDALQDLGKLAGGIASGPGGGAGGLFDGIQKSIDGLVKQISDVIAENRPNVLATTQAFASAAPRISGLIDEATSFTRSLHEGGGTLPRLINDDEIYRRVDDAITNLQTFAGNLNNSSGTLSMLVNDPTLGHKVEATVDSIHAAADSFHSTADTFHGAADSVKAIVDRNGPVIDKVLQGVGDAVPKVTQGIDSFVSIGEKIDKGDGTVSKLINSPELYNSVRDAVNQIKRTFEEGEEQGVMRTFLGVFFGSVL